MTDIPSDSLITVDEAIARLDALPVTPRVETIDLLDADGRVLATSIVADRDSPAFDKSLVDGYAVRATDIDPVMPLRDVGEIAAGGAADRPLRIGECIAIMTGAPLPTGADAVCPVESTTSESGRVTFTEAMVPGKFVEARGTHWRRGEVLLPPQTLLTPAALAVAASVGAARVNVFARPCVGVLTTGDEVVPFDHEPGPSQLRNSNGVLIVTLIKRLGCDVAALGHAADDPADIATRLQSPNLDAICVTGGMSMGRHDQVPRVLRELGFGFAITKLRMRPGKPFVVATKPVGPIVFGLPGNPVSGFVCVVRLASRLLQRIAGRSAEPQWAVATLQVDLPANGPREFYQPAVFERGTLRPLHWRGSADVLTLARANALVRRPPNAPAVTAGDSIDVVMLP